MRVFAISDIHLSINNPKPMDIFGESWENYVEEIFNDWKKRVTDEDIVLLAGDFSWAMKLDEAEPDFKLFSSLPGKKVFIRGNHDYWWQSISAVRKKYNDFYFLQNDAIKFENIVICGSRGWLYPSGKNNTERDKALYARELIRIEMSLKEGQKLLKEGDILLVMTHYPPYILNKFDTQMVKLFEKYNVSKVVFGHLHGKKQCDYLYKKINNIEYYLTSCDQVDNKLITII